MIARLIVALCLGLAAFAAQAHEVEKADKVLVDKGERQIHLLRDGEVWKSYPIGLGFAPEGHKQHEGDGRTPEGDYILDWRNPKSSFYLSIHISYPDTNDKTSAKENGVSPGGAIFIHGEQGLYGRDRDWTLGCIAVTNEAMDEIWATVPNGTPITIRP
ncbi:MAG: L,D-transpeptidase family protein [Proteobacteria bacterium]|nr:L,D-transpeptidase family protein [Pseudomonadota bacterium]